MFPPCLGVVVILQYHHVLLTLMNASVFSLVFELYNVSELKEMKKAIRKTHGNHRHFSILLTLRPAMSNLASKLVQIGTKWNKSGNF